MRGMFVGVGAGLVLEALAAVSGQQRESAAACRPVGSMVTVSELPEGSGIAVSRRVAGRLWAHNDSGKPMIYALNAHGTVTATLALTGATVDDWEAVAVGPCGGGSCLYVGDIGDNSARRSRVSIYRVEEPAAGATSAAVKDVLHATYPDGAHDAEALLVSRDGAIFIVTKGDTGAIALYRFPRELRPGATHTLERVGQPRGRGESREDGKADRVTDGAISADGAWVVLRSVDRLTFYRAPEFLSGSWRAAAVVDLKAIGEAQGEGVAMDADGTVYLVGESGGRERGGTFAKLTCVLR